MNSTESGKTISVKPIQSENACFPIVVTELGISISLKDEHPAKAESPIV